MFALLTAESQSLNIMTYDATITISIVLAICALFAPSITALINNHHYYKLKKLELAHDELIHNTDLQYRNKYEAYKKFIESAGHYSVFCDYSKNFSDITSSLQSSLLLCDNETRILLLNFQKHIENYSGHNVSEYVQLLSSIANSFNRELSLLSRSNHN